MSTLVDHTFARSASRSQSIMAAVFGTLATTLHAWYSRSLQRQHLLRLNAAELNDMGINDSAARCEAAKPFWQE